MSTPKNGRAAREVVLSAAQDSGAGKRKNSRLSALVEYIPEAPPIAYATIKRGRECWGLSVTCPFCGREHYHGGGDGQEPTFGHRVAHCHASAGYVLMPAPRSVQ